MIAHATTVLDATIPQLREIEARVLDESSRQVLSALSWAKVKPEQTEPTPEDIAALGYDEAWERFRIALAAQQNQRDAPMGLHVAAQIAGQRIKNLSAGKSSTLQVAILMPDPNLRTPEGKYEVLDITELFK